MTNQSESIAMEVNGERVSLDDLLRLAKWNGQLQFVQAALDAALLRQAAVARGIKVSVDELQQAADDFRVTHELYSSESTEAWLKARHLTYEDWELLLEEQCLVHKLRELLTANRVEQFFAENSLDFEVASISRILIETEDVARELRAQIADDGADFHALAREYSIDTATKPAGGYTGPVRRVEMDALMETAIYGANCGDVVGPVKTSRGWALIKVETFQRIALNDATRETIKSQLLEEWLDERRRQALIRIPLLEESLAQNDEQVNSIEASAQAVQSINGPDSKSSQASQDR